MIAKRNIQTHEHKHMSRVRPVNVLFHTWDRCLFFLVDSWLKISLEKKSRQIQAESSDFILNPATWHNILQSKKVQREGSQQKRAGFGI